MRNWIGKTLVVFGIIHCIFGFVVFYDIFVELLREMLFNSVNRQLDRHAAFWYVFFGFALMIIGGLIDWIERKQLELPSFLRWVFLAITLLGCFSMPTSGFWLLFVPTILLLQRNKELA